MNVLNSLPLDLIKVPSEDVLLKIASLEGYDFSQIRSDVMRKEGWDEGACLRVELKAKQYFSLAFIDPGGVHAPENDVDIFWHHMILRTKWYQDFCDAMFGCFFHHNPEPTIAGKPAFVLHETQGKLSYWFYGRDILLGESQCNNENCNNENCNNENCNNENCNNENCNNDAQVPSEEGINLPSGLPESEAGDGRLQ